MPLIRTKTEVVVLDAAARPVGRIESTAAHRLPGHRHLAFSVLLRSADGRVLLQRRSHTKDRFAGAWANTCCSHPEPGESVIPAARQRLAHELGLDAEPLLMRWGAFWYRAIDRASGFVEFEYDIVLVGELPAATELRPNPTEVADTAWFSIEQAKKVASGRGERPAPWLAQVLSTAAGPPQGVPTWLASQRTDEVRSSA